MNLADFIVRSSAQTDDGGRTVVTAYHPSTGEVTVVLRGYPVTMEAVTTAVLHALQVKGEATDAAESD